MSVARCLEVNRRLRAAGVVVHEWAGWQSRGNGTMSAYEGALVHHTASAYGNAPSVLVNGRSDLSGPLCNYAGNADGSVTVIAAHPANHAGASGGRSMGPLPVTSLFNKRVMGLEIVYPGDRPMRDAQYRTALVWAKTVTDVLGFGNIGRARAHAETSITGKWDPGSGPGRTIDMLAFRRAADIIGAPAPKPVEEEVGVVPMLCVDINNRRGKGAHATFVVYPGFCTHVKNGAALEAIQEQWKQQGVTLKTEEHGETDWFGPEISW